MSSKVVIPKTEVASARSWAPGSIAPMAVEQQLNPRQETAKSPGVRATQEATLVEPDPKVMDRVRAEAHALGFAEGQRQAEQRLVSEREALGRLLASIEQLRQDLERNLADETLSLSLELARLMIRETLKLNPESVLPILRDAVAALPGLGQHTVLHANPEDAALLQPLLTKDPAFTQLTWTVAEDPRMERGGCRLETAQSEVDATLATRWSRVVAALGREDSWRIESKIS